MKILQVIPYFIPAMQYGGPIPIVYELSKTMIQKNQEVTIITTNANGTSDLDKATNIPYCFEGIAVHYFKRIKFEKALSLIPYLGKSVGYFYAPDLKKYLEVNILNYDIVHLHEFFSYPAISAGRIAKANRVPYVMHLHGMLDPHTMSRRQLKKKIYFKVMGNKLFSQSNGIIANTNSEKLKFEDFNFSAPVATIPNGINPTIFNDDLNDRNGEYFGFGSKKVVLYLGRIHPNKGIDLLISAFSKIVIDNKEALLAIVGPDEIGYKKDLVRMVSELGLNDQVNFFDLVAGEKKDYLLNRADVFSLTSHSEGFSIAILEALAAGKPVVITEGCNFPDVEHYQAGFISPCDSENIALKLNAVLNDKVLCKKMGKNAIKLIQDKYTWDHIADQTIKFYNEILSRN